MTERCLDCQQPVDDQRHALGHPQHHPFRMRSLTPASVALLDKLTPHPSEDWDEVRYRAGVNRRLALADDLRAIEAAVEASIAAWSSAPAYTDAGREHAIETLVGLCNRDIEGQFEEATGWTFDRLVRPVERREGWDEEGKLRL